MTFNWKLILFAVMTLLLAIAIVIASHYRSALTKTEASLTEVNRELNLAKDTIKDMQTRQRDVAALDAKYTQELADANAENDALRKRLDNGGRVRVKGSCPVSATTKTSGTSGMGNDATVELSDVAGRNVLSIRAGIISDQTSLKVLQDYIRQQCLK
ncbi:TPA: lysis protein [Cronobacter sakazakii]|uniref:lysis protein n=1 Tax=Cronobacter sakazakii TaxID=28141 RepID=UPI000CFCEE64|nr:lysis protein [Cronobacter sakazakii]EGT4443954.1 lysis protein [Cronobacter sakazakii]EGT5709225.1 lysis protein [Cronobacter sakazakii]EJG0809377.1 lysis protein [Cronobacter sakazakii]ELY4686590.1 lysis protein [Cronobacter sakazakii]ELY5782302.1 lysis protein [Cronobacter sakazakii]